MNKRALLFFLTWASKCSEVRIFNNLKEPPNKVKTECPGLDFPPYFLGPDENAHPTHLPPKLQERSLS